MEASQALLSQGWSSATQLDGSHEWGPCSDVCNGVQPLRTSAVLQAAESCPCSNSWVMHGADLARQARAAAREEELLAQEARLEKLRAKVSNDHMASSS